MKKLSLLAALLVTTSTLFAAEPSTTKMLFRDYSVKETVGVGGLSVGAASWTDEDNDFGVGGYFDVKFLMLWDELLNFGVGMVAKPPPEDAHYRLDVRLETSVSTHLFKYLEVGAWWAPFWGLVKEQDPYGIMIGYVFKF